MLRALALPILVSTGVLLCGCGSEHDKASRERLEIVEDTISVLDKELTDLRSEEDILKQGEEGGGQIAAKDIPARLSRVQLRIGSTSRRMYSLLNERAMLYARLHMKETPLMQKQREEFRKPSNQ